MNLIIETDIGHDPDDFFAICYLIASGVNVRAILISPGDPDQIAIARFLCDQLGLDIPIGVSKAQRTKLSSGSIHHQLLIKYGCDLSARSSGLGVDIMEDVLRNHPDCELFVIGPASSVGEYMRRHSGHHFPRATMQGGFLPYSLHVPVVTNKDFAGRDWIGTFNLNGDRPAGLAFLAGNVGERRMVGKNICHTVQFSRDLYLGRLGRHGNRAWELFHEAARMYFERHDMKKFHDPTAACLHLHPEIGTWYRGKTVKREQGWTTESGDDYVLADVDYVALWDHLLGAMGNG